jgi:hypothetical protein
MASVVVTVKIDGVATDPKLCRPPQVRSAGMRSITVDERRARLARRHFLLEPAESAEEVVADLVGLHTTDPATPYLSLWARLTGFAVSDLDAEVYRRRTLVKHLAMRRTLWTVRAADLPLIQVGASDRVAANERRRLAGDAQRAGVTPDGEKWLDTACAAVLRHLAEHGAASAKELRMALPELTGRYHYAPGRRWGGQTPLAPRVLTVLSAQGDIVRGPNDGGWRVARPRWEPMAHWLPALPGRPQPEIARAELVRRWLRTFGPATITDISWWFGSTLGWAREALQDVEAVEVDIDGAAGFVLPDDVEAEPAVEPWCALLPGLDITTMGWVDRDWYIGDHRDRIFDRSGNAGPTAWWDGRVVGGWTQDADGRIVVQPLEQLSHDAVRALRQRADDLTAWLDGVRVNPRFPSPLSKR